METGFFDAMQQAIRALPAAVQLLLAMGVVSVGDVIAAIVEGPFHGTLLGQWVRSKLLPIISVALLYTMDFATGLFTIQLGDLEIGAFAALAYAGASTFIAQEAFSIIKHLKVTLNPGNTDPVPEE